MPDILLTTERLILRRFTADDAENLYELDHDPEVMRFINGGVSTPRDVTLHKLLPNFLNYDRRFPGFGFWAVTEKSSKAFLGWLSFRPTGLDPEEKTPGFRLRKNAWGKDYAT